MKAVIQIHELHKSYDNHVVLKGVTFSVNKGEIFALLGVNGAGKTTALECIEGLRNYDSGKIFLEGKRGIQLQSSSLPEYIRAGEAIRLFAKWNKASIDQDMLTSLGVKQLMNKQYHELSAGQKRRLHLALALIGDPDIVFLDEPTAGLDVEGRNGLHKQIAQLKARGKTVLLTSHDMAEVETLCDRLAILNDGKIIFIGTAEELTAKVGTQYTISIKTVQGTQALQTDDVENTLLLLLARYKTTGEKILDIHVSRGSLEQHFLKMAKGKQE
jgi:ABC-2 type transport system ATP-binding protein